MSLARTLSVHPAGEERSRHDADVAAYDAAWLALLNGLAAARGAGPKPKPQGLGQGPEEGKAPGAQGGWAVAAAGGGERARGQAMLPGPGPGPATRVADVPLLPPAPWNCKPGHRVRARDRAGGLILVCERGGAGWAGGRGADGHGCAAQGSLSSEQERALRALRAQFPESAAFHTDDDLLRWAARLVG